MGRGPSWSMPHTLTWANGNSVASRSSAAKSCRKIAGSSDAIVLASAKGCSSSTASTGTIPIFAGFAAKPWSAKVGLPPFAL